jgi:hypothetical protein
VAAAVSFVTLSAGGRAAKGGHLLAGARRQGGVFILCRYDLGLLLATATARPIGEILGIGVAVVLKGVGVSLADLDDGAGTDEEARRQQ